MNRTEPLLPDNPTPTIKAPLTAEETARILSAWQLTPAQHSSILQTQILPAELHPFLPSTTNNTNQLPTITASTTRPKAVLILGQTGAGKTRLAPLLLSALTSLSPTRTPLHLIADTFKTYHPFYTTCLSQHPNLASRLTRRDAAAWLLAVCTHAAQAHHPAVLVETACRRPSDFQRIVKAFATEGYDVRVVVLAVPPALSRLGILVRYWRRLPEAGSQRHGLPVRLTPRVVHDESWEGLRVAVGWVDRLLLLLFRATHSPASSTTIGTTGTAGAGGGRKEGDKEEEEEELEEEEEEEGRVERVVVVRRNGGVVYDSETSRRSKGQEEAGEAGEVSWALEQEWVKGLSVEERRTAEEDLQMLRGLGDPDVDREIDEVEGLLAELGSHEPVGNVVPFDAVNFVSTSVVRLPHCLDILGHHVGH
ncbi:hypothetical protein N657DRAFT_433983 [Parathielavia appendiculata]|uniref:Zeta toxin domain-containing protein n=1 Tax=Parathielavia appendiculata TaxID=2587402 RepID=A0AAN6U0W5_9PEZI|nr:hypothetical protein N657DRAFT_433983 [Parathielavia appendiculata]